MQANKQGSKIVPCCSTDNDFASSFSQWLQSTCLRRIKCKVVASTAHRESYPAITCLRLCTTTTSMPKFDQFGSEASTRWRRRPNNCFRSLKITTIRRSRKCWISRMFTATVTRKTAPTRIQTTRSILADSPWYLPYWSLSTKGIW